MMLKDNVGPGRLATLVAVIVVAVAALPGCATIVHGSMQNIAVSSTPDKASVIVNGTASGVTPTTVRLERKRKDQTIRLELDGYQPHEVTLKRGIDGWFWGDIILLSPLGVVIDASTGAMYKLSPKSVSATLAKATAYNDGDVLHINVVLQADPSWERIDTLKPAR